MRIVTELEEFTKSRVKVYIDQEFAFVLYKGELRILEIKKDQTITDENYQKIMKEILPKRAKLRSMNLMKSKDYTEYQLRDKLRQGLYPQEIIDEAIEYVKSYHYIDDSRYAKGYIVYHSDTRSRNRIIQDLTKKGVAKEVILEAYEEAVENEKLTEETVLIQKLVEKRHYDPQKATYEEQQKMLGFLYRKGFSIDKIRDVICLT